VPDTLSDLVLQLLAKKPEERPASARVVAEALLAMEDQPARPSHSPRGGAKTRTGGGTIVEAAWVEPEAVEELPALRALRVDEADAQVAQRVPRADDYAEGRPPWRHGSRADDDRDGRRGSARGFFAANGLTGAAPAFLFIGAAFMIVLLVSVFFPWRTVTVGTERGGRGADFGGFNLPLPDVFGAVKTSGDFSGMQMRGPFGILTFIAAIIGAAFALVGAFVPSRIVLKAGLWTAFAAALAGMACGLLAALLTTTESALFVAGTEKGAWGAWVAAFAGLASALMFLLALSTMSSENGIW
jgi:hypothetical protein